MLAFFPAKLLKLGSIIPEFSWRLFGQLVVADLLFITSVFLLLAGISRLARPGLVKPIRVLVALFLFPVAALAIIEHKYFLSTGSLLDARLIVYGLAESANLIGAYKAEAHAGWWLALALSVPLGIGLARLASGPDAAAQSRPILGMALMLAGATCLWKSSDTTIPEDFRLYGLEKNMILKLAGEIGTNREYQDSYGHTATAYPAAVNIVTTPATNFSNVVMVILESVRADATTPYDPSLGTTPYLDNLAKNGLLVEQGYVVVPHTSTSLISILCGYPPDPRSAFSQRARKPLPPFCLPALLQRIGYSSAFFQSAYKHFEGREALVADMGFDHFTSHQDLSSQDWQQANYFGLEERAMLAPMMDWVDAQDTPFLLGVLTLMSHHNYEVPKNFPKITYSGSPAWSDYLNTVRYQDEFIRELVEEFARRALLDTTLFVFVGDHGQGFREHGLASQDLPYDEAARIPIVFYNRTLIPEPVSAEGFRNHLDIAPTLMELLGLAVTSGRFWGDSLLSTVEDRPIFLSCWKPRNCSARMGQDGKFIYFPALETGQLFDLDSDPLETNNLVDTMKPEVQTRWISEIGQWTSSIAGYHSEYQPEHAAE